MSIQENEIRSSLHIFSGILRALAVLHIFASSALNDVSFVTQHEMVNVDFRALEPLSRTHEPPNHDYGEIRLAPSGNLNPNDYLLNRMGPKNTRHVQFMRDGVRSDPETEGRLRIGIINEANETEITPDTGLNLPRCHGPGRNRPRTAKVRRAMGVTKQTMAATAPLALLATRFRPSLET